MTDADVESLGTQRNERIHGRGLSRWDVTSENADQSEERSDRRKRNRIDSFHAEQETGKQTRGSEGAQDAAGDARYYQSESVFDDVSQHGPAACTECHADTDFADALVHGVCEYAIQAGGRKQ